MASPRWRGATRASGAMRSLALMWNRLEDDGPVAVPATYLESVGTARG